jgi:hypothetical protein
MGTIAIRCPYCAGDVQIDAGQDMGKCEYCGSMITISKNADKISNIFNRANQLRVNRQFDKAIREYEEILREDNTDAVAHWELALSKYGIDYVEDPRTKQRIPTLNRANYKSFLDDYDYRKALEYSQSEESRRLYETKAYEINDILQEYMNIARNAESYDIFICYKESDDVQGGRTQASVEAQEIYNDLQDKGYKVFFARKTLSQVIGQKYEPYIFAALNSAKVMLVVGTKKEEFEAVWVRNEWSRFLELKAENHDKEIIPIYRNISPYDLPYELQMQAVDMNKIGFKQDLYEGIKRIIVTNSAEIDETHKQDSEVNRIYKNGMKLLRLEKYTDAYDTFSEITHLDPDRYEGWWGIVLAQTHNLKTGTISSREALDKIYNVYIKHDIKMLATEEEYKDVISKFARYYAGECILIEKMETRDDLTVLKKVYDKYTNDLKKVDVEEDIDEHNFQGYLNNLDNELRALNKLQNQHRFRRVISIIGYIILIILFIMNLSLRDENLALFATFAVWIVAAAILIRVFVAACPNKAESIQQNSNSVQTARTNNAAAKKSFENKRKTLRHCLSNIQNVDKIKKEYLAYDENALNVVYYNKILGDNGYENELDKNLWMFVRKATLNANKYNFEGADEKSLYGFDTYIENSGNTGDTVNPDNTSNTGNTVNQDSMSNTSTTVNPDNTSNTNTTINPDNATNTSDMVNRDNTYNTSSTGNFWGDITQDTMNVRSNMVYTCPMCGTRIEYGVPMCGYCGQALIWQGQK